MDTEGLLLWSCASFHSFSFCCFRIGLCLFLPAAGNYVWRTWGMQWFSDYVVVHSSTLDRNGKSLGILANKGEFGASGEWYDKSAYKSVRLASVVSGLTKSSRQTSCRLVRASFRFVILGAAKNLLFRSCCTPVPACCGMWC